MPEVKNKDKMRECLEHKIKSFNFNPEDYKLSEDNYMTIMLQAQYISVINKALNEHYNELKPTTVSRIKEFLGISRDSYPVEELADLVHEIDLELN